MTRILTLLDDILSSTSSRSRVPKKNVPRDMRNLKLVRSQRREEGKGEVEGVEDRGKDKRREVEGGPLRASTLLNRVEQLLVPKQGGEDPVFRFNTVKCF